MIDSVQVYKKYDGMQLLGYWHGLEVWGYLVKGGIVGDSDVPYGTYREADCIEDMMVLLPDGASLDEILDARMMDEIEDCILAQQ